MVIVLGMKSENFDDILSQSKNEMENSLNKENLDVEDLEELLGAEKEGKDRETVKSLLENLVLSKRLLVLLDRDEGSFDNINSIKSSLDDIKEVKKLNSLNPNYDKVEIVDNLFGTVSEFKNYSKELNLDSDDAELILKVEISGKNRKGVKERLKDKINYFKEDKAKFERKIELKDDLGLDVSNDWLENVSLQKLEETKKEKDNREKLISDISKEVDDSKEKLKKVSTSDLEKIASELFNH